MLGLALPLGLRAQSPGAPAWTGARTTGTGVLHSKVDQAGNVYEVSAIQGTTAFADSSFTSRGSSDFALVKYTPTGQVAWRRQIGGPSQERVYDVTLDAAGNLYVVGQFGASVDFGGQLLTSPAGVQGFLVRYSPQGVAEWVQSFDGDVTRVRTDGSGQVVVCGNYFGALHVGSTTLTAAPGSTLDIFLARFSSQGALQWLQPAYYYYGNDHTLRDVQLAVAPSGVIYLAAELDTPPTVGNTTLTTRGLFDVMVLKYTTQGQLDWVRQFGGPGEDRVFGAATDQNASLYLTGDLSAGATFGSLAPAVAGQTDAYLAKYDANGTVAWVQTGGGPGEDIGYDLAVEAGGNAYMVGYYSGTAQFGPYTLQNSAPSTTVALAYSPQGQLRWVQQTGGSSGGYTATLTPTGDLHVLGHFTGSITLGGTSLTTSGRGSFVARLPATALATAGPRAQVLSPYPNPATDQLHLPALPTGARVQLIDALGRVVRTAAPSAATPLSVRGLRAGLYVLRATDARGRAYTGHVVVE